MYTKIGNQFFNLDNIESYEFVNNNKSVIIHTVSGRMFLYDVADVNELMKYLDFGKYL
jgi:hypothetical protein